MTSKTVAIVLHGRDQRPRSAAARLWRYRRPIPEDDRKLHAFDAQTGKLLWEFPTNSGILAPPSSYSIDGTQYIAIQSGWGIDSRGMQSRLNTITNGAYPEVPEGGAVWVSALP